jgi:hypothetical protein
VERRLQSVVWARTGFGARALGIGLGSVDRARPVPRAVDARHGLLAAAVVLAAICALTLAGPAAASPVKGARYAGERYYQAHTHVALRVSPDGRRLSAAINLYSGCQWVSIRLTGRRNPPVQIHRNGSFRLVSRRIKGVDLFSDRVRRFDVRMRGRFTSRDTAKIAFRERGHKLSSACNPGHLRFTLHRTGPPPFSGCASQPAGDLVRGPTGRLFVQRQVHGWRDVDRGDGIGEGGDGYIFRPFLYGCLYETNTRVRLGIYGGYTVNDQSLEHLRLAGVYGAYYLSVYSESDAIYVVDLRDGRKVRAINLFPHLESVSDLELKDNASVACITAATSGPDRHPAQVVVRDSAGRRVVASSPLIDTKSLTLEGSTISWLEAGVQHSATLD